MSLSEVLKLLPTHLCEEPGCRHQKGVFTPLREELVTALAPTHAKCSQGFYKNSLISGIFLLNMVNFSFIDFQKLDIISIL